MTKQEANVILAAVNELMIENFPTYNAKMTVRRYMDSGQVSFKMELTDKNAADGIDLLESEIGMSKNRCHPDTIGFSFEVSGRHYVVESVKNRKCKMPVLCRDEVDGKLYKFQADYINDRIADINRRGI